MNLLERTIRTFAPRVALGRERARIALELVERARSYDAASLGRRTGGWRAPDSSPVAAIRGSLSRLRNRSRELGRNSAWAGKAVRIIKSNVLGGQGLTPEPITEKDSERKEILGAWAEWANCTDCDASGMVDFAGLQRLVMHSIVEAGEVIVRRRPRRAADGLAVPLQLQVLEPDHLDDELDTYAAGENQIVQGVEYDGIGRRVAYHLHRTHPGDAIFSNWERVRVPADSVAHVYRIERPGQVRGVPWGSPALLRLRAWDSAMDSELERLVIASSFVGFVHDLNGGDVMNSPLGEVMQGEDAQDPAKGSRQQFEPGTFQNLPNGKTITFGKPEPFEDLPGYGKLSLREIASAYGVPYEDLAGDLEGVNFSSGRMGRITFQREVSTWQQDLMVVGFLERVWDWWSRTAFLAGRIRKILPVEWQLPGREFLDPVQETQALTSSVQSGFQSLSGAVKSLGRNPDTVMRQLARDKDLAVTLKLALAVFPDLAPRPGQAQASSAKDE